MGTKCIRKKVPCYSPRHTLPLNPETSRLLVITLQSWLSSNFQVLLAKPITLSLPVWLWRNSIISAYYCTLPNADLFQVSLPATPHTCCVISTVTLCSTLPAQLKLPFPSEDFSDILHHNQLSLQSWLAKHSIPSLFVSCYNIQLCLSQRLEKKFFN